MKKIFTILLSALLLTLPCGQAQAQTNKNANDYYLQRAWEALREENDESKAMDLVTRQLRETPDNVNALLLRVRLYRSRREYGTALSDINHALKVNKPKKSGVPMSTLYWWKGHIYQDMNETVKSCEAFGKAYTLARRDNRDNLQDISFDYGCLLALLERWEEADAVFDAMLKEDETDASAMVGKASTLISRGRDSEAVGILDKAQKYAENYAEVYRFRMTAYRNLGEYNKAIDAAIAYYDKCDNPVRDTVLAVFSKKPNYAIASLKSKARGSEDPYVWKSLLAGFYEYCRDYAEAIRAYDALEEEFGKYDYISYHRSECYSGLGLYERAADELTGLIEKEPDWYLYVSRGDDYRLAGRLDEAIADFSAAYTVNGAFTKYVPGFIQSFQF